MLPQRQRSPPEPDHRLPIPTHPAHPTQPPLPARARSPEAPPRGAGHRLPSLDLEPSLYAGLLRRASRGRSLPLARLTHSHMIRAGYRPGLFLSNNLLAAYVRCADTRSARLLFDGMPRRDVVTWNTLIAGYATQGSARLALGAFRDARRDGAVAVDRFTYAAVLAACGGAGDWRSGRAAHGLAVVSGLARTAFVSNSVIDMYAKCRMIDEVRLAFDRAEERDEVSWNLLLSAYVRMGWPEVAVNVLVWMHRSGVELDAFALGGILKACSELEDSEDVRRMLHGCVIKVGLDLDVFVGSTMVDMYAKNGGLEEAIKVFGSIPSQNVIYNTMIAGFARLGNDPCPEIRMEAVRIYSNMFWRRIRPSKFTFKSVLEVCNLTNAVRCWRQIHAHVILFGFEDDEFIGNALINLYSKARLVDDSLRCFHRTAKQEIFTWTSMITAFVHNEHSDKALNLFKELCYTGAEPDQFTMSSVMNACADLSMPIACEQIHCYAVKSGFDRFTLCGNSQIEMYRCTGDLKAAKKTFDRIPSLDTFSWSQMILSYAVHGHEREALQLFKKMRDCSVIINEFAFLAVLVACSHQGLIDEGFRHYESMVSDCSFVPDVKHIACMVDLLGHVGKVADAEDFINSSGLENDSVLWHTLLRACRIHGDKDRGIKTGEKLMMLEPFAASSYVMLYNLYMDAGKISLAMRTRGQMRERGMTKESGVSWAEFGGSCQHFVDGDNSCSQKDATFTRLEELLVRVKQKTERGSMNVWELGFQSRKVSENSIDKHGELLAVALGLSTLPNTAPVRVMKNQRMSWEGHETLKLLSESENREIIIRDPARFHHFSQGSCSCRGYW